MSRALLPPLLTLGLLLAACVSTESAMPGETAGAPANVVGSEWQLRELGGVKAIPSPEATLAFLDGTRASGSGTCNRFTATYELSGNSIKFGPIASTRRACPPEIAGQEERYFASLQNAERIASGGPDLLIFSKGADKPLRFTRAATAKPAQ
jgi:heat shock protein HslJ